MLYNDSMGVDDSKRPGTMRLFARATVSAVAALLLAGCGPSDSARLTESETVSPTPQLDDHVQPLGETSLEPPLLTDLPDEPPQQQQQSAEQVFLSEDRPEDESGPREATELAQSQAAADTSTGAIALTSGVSEQAAGPDRYRDWPTPEVTLVVTGQQHGYIEPCGCTGLENQKGGVARRYTLLDQLKAKGWDLVPIDAGNLVRRTGRQAEIKFHRSIEALRKMNYAALGFGPDDLRLGVGDLIQEAAAESKDAALYVAANVVLLDPSLMPQYKVVDRGGMKIAMTTILDPDSLDAPVSDEIVITPPAEALRESLEAMKSENPDFRVLSFFGDEVRAEQLMRDVPGFDLIIVAGGYGEPTYQPQAIEGSKTQMILPGSKGMYAGLVGLYRDQPMKYARVALTHEFKDAPEMRKLMAEYQQQLKALGLSGLGLRPIPHPSGRKYVGSQACGECHTAAFDVWESSMHALATQHLVEPPKERGDVPRHFDPECLSCHVTGWNPQNYYPYETGYLSLAESEHLTGSGCENCHGPGAAHVAAESGEVDADQQRLDELRLAMRLPLDKAREHCMQCHDLDNSPDFHEEGAFDEYWAEIEHYGLD